jgi:hypothetical protein
MSALAKDYGKKQAIVEASGSGGFVASQSVTDTFSSDLTFGVWRMKLYGKLKCILFS